MVLLLPMELTLFPESLGLGVKGAECPPHDHIGGAQLDPARAQRGGVGRLFRPEASVAPPVESRAQRPATSVRHRAETWRAVRYHDADRAAEFALHADAVRRD